MMLHPLFAALALAAVPLAGCSDHDGTSISLNATGDNGTMTLSDNGQTGQVAVNLPGFSGKLNLPELHLDGDDVDLNGAHLYPGSKVTGMTINADRGNGVAHIAFDSPADPATVQHWFQSKLADAGFTLHVEGGALVGTTDNGKPFRLELQPGGSGHTKGMIIAS